MSHRSWSSITAEVRAVVLLLLAGLLGGCAAVPVEPAPPEASIAVQEPAAARAESVTEASEPRDARPDPAAPGLQAALEALERNDHAAAMQAWEDVLEQAASAEDQARALLGMVLLRLLPSSAFSDPQAAGSLVDRFDRHVREHGLRREFVAEVELLRLLLARERDLQVLRASNRALSADLEARDNLIRKLRALSVDGG